MAKLTKLPEKKIGRPPKDERFVKTRVTVSLEPDADAAWGKLANNCGVAKGHLAAWLSLSPEAAEARKLALKHARFFIVEVDVKGEK
jgi:hypothetical protein